MLLHYGDLTDTTNLVYIISQVRPTEIYNLAAQSHVKVSFDMAEYTVRTLPIKRKGETDPSTSLQGDVDGLGTLRLLDAIRTCGLAQHIRFYQVRRKLQATVREVLMCFRHQLPSYMARSRRYRNRRRRLSTLVRHTVLPSYTASGSSRITASHMACTPRTAFSVRNVKRSFLKTR